MRAFVAEIGPIKKAFEILDPKNLSSPLVFSSPHSGRLYPPEFLASADLPLHDLRSSEDVAVDALFAAAPDFGAPLLCAKFPRAFLDANREPDEFDPRLFVEEPPESANKNSLRVASGLGVVPRVVSEGRAIYRERLPLAEGFARIKSCHAPYHQALEALLVRAEQIFGVAVLIDCHSMPSRLPTGDARRPYEPLNIDVVIGDRYGASCDPGFAHRLHSGFSRLGYRVARNKPYAGGYITQHYAARHRGRHAIQIELNRALYMDEAGLTPSPRYKKLQDDLTRLIGEIAGGLPAATGLRPAAE